MIQPLYWLTTIAARNTPPNAAAIRVTGSGSTTCLRVSAIGGHSSPTGVGVPRSRYDGPG
ncbi:MAG: hypothetical protein ACFHWZ_13045 [Phycisphaerales bacterium]